MTYVPTTTARPSALTSVWARIARALRHARPDRTTDQPLPRDHVDGKAFAHRHVPAYSQDAATMLALRAGVRAGNW